MTNAALESVDCLADMLRHHEWIRYIQICSSSERTKKNPLIENFQLCGYHRYIIHHCLDILVQSSHQSESKCEIKHVVCVVTLSHVMLSAET